MVDIGSAMGKVFSPVGGIILGFFKWVLFLVFLVVLGFFAYFFIRYRFNPFRLSADKLRKPFIRFKYYDLLRWLLVDYLERDLHTGEFREYGFTYYVGRQGAGKTISLVRYLEIMKEKYPRCLIVTNFKYYRADYLMGSWRDLLTIRNGTDGVIFAIDEIHSEYSSASWKDVPESLLSEISQQRKQRVKIVASAQFFGRVAKPLREQAASVVVCSTFAGRLTRNREYDALQYSASMQDLPALSKKVRPLSKSSFVQSDALRACYDTYEKIERMRKLDFIPRDERGQEG